MKNFVITNKWPKSTIVLASKIEKCECRTCGAIIDKRIYFTGVCPYCGAPIVGVINDSYVCTYCGKRINDVIEKIKYTK